jgi:formamidopyrimidine-DNA glycosylase
VGDLFHGKRIRECTSDERKEESSMLELPEAVVLAEQISNDLNGKRIINVYANRSPHKFAWFYGDPQDYQNLLIEKSIESAVSYGGMVEITAGKARIVFSDGVNLRYFAADEKLPAKHQLQIEFEDSSSLVGSVQMYGGLWVFPDGQFDNRYYEIAREKPSPLKDRFGYEYFASLLPGEKLKSLSAKAFLATEQRIPGLGNGVLQDILWTARIHPKRKMTALSDEELHNVFNAVKSVLNEMVAGGARDTERDLYGFPGGYQTILSKNTAGMPCPACGTAINKEPYMGGSIYYCQLCQKV